MSKFQNDNSTLFFLEKLINLYDSEFLQNHNEELKRVNPTGSEDTARRDQSETKLVRFEELTKNRLRKVLLRQMNCCLSELDKENKLD